MNMKNNSFEDLARIIKELEKEGCSCDLLYGYYCGIHVKANEGYLTIKNIKKKMSIK